MRHWLLLFTLIASGAASAEEPTLTLEEFNKHPPMAEVLLLGTFHFKDAGLDGYKPETEIDIKSEQRQRELADVLRLLAERFKPTKIAIEARGETAERIVQQEYPAWLEGSFALTSNERHQIGFRLGKQLGLTTLYPIDAMGRRYEGLPTDAEAYAAQHGQTDLLRSEWNERYQALYRHEDRKKAERTLGATLVAMNDPARLMASHGHYLLGGIALGNEDEFAGADHVAGWWYNRNLRIFANIRRIAEPGDRILVVIGAGHVPILRHAVQASPEFELVEVADVLRQD